MNPSRLGTPPATLKNKMVFGTDFVDTRIEDMQGKAVLGIEILRVGDRVGPFKLAMVFFAGLGGLKRDTADLPAFFGWPRVALRRGCCSCQKRLAPSPL